MPDSTKLLHWAAALSIVAGIAHGALVEEHLEESIYIGAFFVIAAMAQGVFGFAIFASHLMNGSPISARWPRSALGGWYLAGALGNLVLIAMYVASRTVGFYGKYEGWSAGGIFVKVIELAIVALLAILFAQIRGSSASMRASA